MSAMGWQIHHARVVTGAGEARDTFYVTGRDGEKIEESAINLLTCKAAADLPDY